VDRDPRVANHILMERLVAVADEEGAGGAAAAEGELDALGLAGVLDPLRHRLKGAGIVAVVVVDSPRVAGELDPARLDGVALAGGGGPGAGDEIGQVGRLEADGDAVAGDDLEDAGGDGRRARRGHQLELDGGAGSELALGGADQEAAALDL